MKQIKFLLFFLMAAVCLMTIPACTDLEVEATDSEFIEVTGGFQSGDPAQLLASSYNDLGNFNDQANIYSLFEHVSDEMIPPTRGVDWGDNGVWRTLHAHTWDPTHSWILGAWNQLNRSAYKCNEILASSPNAQQAAEAKFLRAFYMWHVMDLWGQVPIREVTEGVDDLPRVMSRSEAFDYIENDLKEALPALPTAGPAALNIGASKAAANALLARLYLNKAVYKSSAPEGPYTFDAGDMGKVVGYCDAIEADGYSLETEYFNNFTTGAANEIIFVVPNGTPQNRYFMTLHYNQNPSGWNGFTTLAEFYDKFEDSDIRKGIPAKKDGTEFSGIGKGFLIGQQYKDDGSILVDTRSGLPLSFTRDITLAGAATEKGIRAIKYHPADKGQIILMRWAEFQLTKAEALMRSGDNGGALALVNALRANRGATALSSLTEATMLDERGREMYWEGFRRTDQVRFGTFDDTWVEKTVTEPFRVLFPIPQQALDSNPNLTQNTGY